MIMALVSPSTASISVLQDAIQLVSDSQKSAGPILSAFTSASGTAACKLLFKRAVEDLASREHERQFHDVLTKVEDGVGDEFVLVGERSAMPIRRFRQR